MLHFGTLGLDDAWCGFALPSNRNLTTLTCVSVSGGWVKTPRSAQTASRRDNYGREHCGSAAGIIIFGVPIAGIYTYFFLRKFRTEGKLAAIARGGYVPIGPGIAQACGSWSAGLRLT